MKVKAALEELVKSVIIRCEGNSLHGNAIFTGENKPTVQIITYKSGKKEIYCRCFQDGDNPKCNPNRLVMSQKYLGNCIYLSKSKQ